MDIETIIAAALDTDTVPASSPKALAWMRALRGGATEILGVRVEPVGRMVSVEGAEPVNSAVARVAVGLIVENRS